FGCEGNKLITLRDWGLRITIEWRNRNPNCHVKGIAFGVRNPKSTIRNRRHSVAIRSCRSSARHADDDLDGAAASFDPWRVASGTRARRRDGGEVHARHWLSPHGHGETL